MTTERRSPYLWPTWVSPLLSGNRTCAFDVWFRAHYKDYPEQPSTFDSAGWDERHTQLLNEAEEWATALSGYQHHKREMPITYYGTAATMGGKIDLLVELEGEFIVIDAKGGKPKDSDVSQVRLYQWILSLMKTTEGERRYNKPIKGLVYYSKSHKVLIPARSIDSEFRFAALTVIRKVSGGQAVRPVPGRDCRYCKLTIDSCPDRLNVADEVWSEGDEF